MSTRSEALLTDLSKNIGLRNLSFDNNKMCSFAIDQKYRVSLFADGEEHLIIYGLVGGYSNEIEDTVLLELLSINSSFARSQGPYLSIEMNSKIFILMKALNLDEIDVSILEAQIEHMVQNQEYIESVLQEKGIILREIE